MWDTVIKALMPDLVNLLLTIFVALLNVLGAYAIAFLRKQKQAAITKSGVEQYNYLYTIARSIYFAVEQQFKDAAGAGEDKCKAFEAKILQLVPYLTQEEIDHFREAIVGEINSITKDSGILEPAKTTYK